MTEKPLELLRLDFVESVVDLINNSNLPAFIMHDIFKDLTAQLSDLSAIQLEKVKAAYNDRTEAVDEDKR